MRLSLVFCVAILTTAVLSSPGAESHAHLNVSKRDQPALAITFSEKSQIRSSMRWMQGLPKLIVGGSPGLLDGDSHALPGVSRISPSGEASAELSGLPYSAIGKLFFVRPDNSVATCNGAFVGSPNTVLTAAHCVLGESGEWNKHFLFVQRYGKPNQDVYAVSCAAVPAEWGTLMGRESYGFDYAFIKLRRPGSEGVLGLSSGLPPESLQLVGYSDNIDDGRSMIELTVRLDAHEANRLRSSLNPLKSGSSGMPWMASSIVHSVSSHWYPSEESAMWGPRFTSDTFSLMRFVDAGCT